MSYNSLNPPPLVRDKPAHEVLRAAFHNGELHFSLRRGFDDAGAWGVLLADAARHVSRAYAHEKMLSEEDALERIRLGFEAAIRETPEGMSHTTEVKDAP
jgi:hypothetical protein